ncbi:amidohydrolase (plasmid) [Burkholderia sp. FERM BP-3421]|jgi:predicted TIM-barrel fold metal-dependent hydrolase|uniref:amidohydrolase family protein n=1 Tax=Burkholderia sp. FERM BP-3421 TaxID=1494466 RepID=UPI002362F91B|nr:amidohydrolase family protein [Burkholderia sp. FERM BP-3421]WDD90711.1 amidohydrolase [Burkholderia sp. FERM BP-3421]
MSTHRVIDADGHVLEPVDLWERYIDSAYRGRAPKIIEDETGLQRVVVDGRLFPRHHYGLNGAGSAGAPVVPPAIKTKRYEFNKAGGFDSRERLKDMDLEGIDVAVLFPTLGMFLTGIQDRPLSERISIAYNNWLHDYCSVDTDRLKGYAHLPLLDVQASIRELRRAVTELGMVGVYMRPNPYGHRNLDDAEYDPLWEAIVDLDVCVGFHEGANGPLPIIGADRYEANAKGRYNHYISHVLSHPFEQQFACLTLIAGGVFERFPDLRVAFMESGVGWLPYWVDRMDKDFEHLGWYVPDLQLKPSEYFQRNCWVSCDPDEVMLNYVAATMGDDNLLFASDYPHFDAMFPGAVAAIANRTELSASSKEKILGLNAERLLKLSSRQPAERDALLSGARA